jgi:hypothetical protein
VQAFGLAREASTPCPAKAQRAEASSASRLRCASVAVPNRR